MATQLKKVVAPSGGDYTSLEACLNANEQDLTAADKYFDVEISGTWSSADTTQVNFHNYTTDSTRYVNVYTTGAARHSGVKNTGYTLTPSSDNVNVVSVASKYLTLDGIEFEAWGGSGVKDAISGGDDARYLTVKNCIFHSFSNEGRGIWVTWTAYIYNNIFQDFSVSSGYVRACGIGDGNIYNNTAVNINSKTTGYSPAFASTYASPVTKNNICLITSGADGACYGGLSQEYNISSDTSSTGTGAITNSTIALCAFVSTSDLHITAGSAAYDAGTDLSGTITTDIDDETRSRWDIGADEYSAGTTPAARGFMTTNKGYW